MRVTADSFTGRVLSTLSRRAPAFHPPGDYLSRKVQEDYITSFSGISSQRSVDIDVLSKSTDDSDFGGDFPAVAPHLGRYAHFDPSRDGARGNKRDARRRSTAPRLAWLSLYVKVLRNLWWLLVVIGGGGVGMWSLGRPGGWYVTIGTILVTLSVVIFGAGLVLVRRATGPPYTLKAAEYEYQFDHDDPRRQVQLTRIWIQANRDDVILFRQQYYWTGQGESHLRSLNDHRIVAEGTNLYSNTSYYIVLFDRPLKRGETTSIIIRQDFFDEGWKLQPVFSSSPDETAERLTLRVVYPAGWEPKRVMGQELVRLRNSDAGWLPIRQSDINIERVGDRSVVVYEADAARRGRRYALYWGPWPRYGKAN